MPENPTIPKPRPRLPRRLGNRMQAFTMIELLVVMVIIAILFAAVLTGRTVVMNSARTRDTRATLQIVEDALEQFKREQTSAPTIVRAAQGGVRYIDRYGPYPADELEIFTKVGLPNSTPPGGSLAVGKAGARPEMVPKPGGGYPNMDFDPSEDPEFEHRDIAAMVLAISEFGDESKVILDKVPGNRRVSGPLDDTGMPLQFLDRNANDKFDPELDEEIRYIVDAWGVPLTYFAQRDFEEGEAEATVSTNAPEWNEGSTEMIRLNGGRPIIMSYGPDGRDQLTKDFITENPAAILINDFEDDHKVNDPSNEDNVYADEALKAKLAAGIQE